MNILDINHPYYEPLLISKKSCATVDNVLNSYCIYRKWNINKHHIPSWNQQFAPENGWQRKMIHLSVFVRSVFPKPFIYVPIPSHLRFWVKSTNLSLMSCWPLPAFRLTPRMLRRWKLTLTRTSDVRFRASRVKVGRIGRGEVKGVGGGHVNVAVEHGLFWVKQAVFVFTRCGKYCWWFRKSQGQPPFE